MDLRDRDGAPAERRQSGVRLAARKLLRRLVALLAALQSPLDPAAERSFVLHQVQHLLLQSLGPMLLMLAAPQPMLVAGTPRWLRAGALSALLSSRPMRAAFAFAARPFAATLLFVGSVFFWHVPAYHELALVNDAVHYLMHVTMLVSGMLFFWRLFDPRPGPAGAGYGARLTMVIAAIAATTPLGAFLALKSSLLYPGYDANGRLWLAITPLQDEQLGGLVMWIPGGLALAIAALLLIRLWGASENALERRARRDQVPPAVSTRQLASRNRALAFRLLAIAVSMLAGTMLAASLGRL